MKYHPCAEAEAWMRKQPTAAKAWAACPRGDWLLWIAARTCAPGSAEHKSVVLAACACARTALKHVTSGDKRPLRAIEAAERWTRGEATIGEVMNARAASVAAAASSAADAASDAAAYAAAYAAADAAAYAYARTKTLAKCAVLVRKRLKVQDIR